MTASELPAASPSRTAWARNLETPLRRFLRTETGSAAFLLAATIAALAWVNIDPPRTQATWHTILSSARGRRRTRANLAGLGQLRSDGLLLPASRAWRRGASSTWASCASDGSSPCRWWSPSADGRAGRHLPGDQRGHASAPGWGAAMSTDTAFALGLLALLGPASPIGLRTYLLTFALVETGGDRGHRASSTAAISTWPRSRGGLGSSPRRARRARRGVRSGLVYLLLASRRGLRSSSPAWTRSSSAWLGLLALAYPAARGDLEQASESFRLFREQPTPELASEPGERPPAISPNDRLQQLFHPWTSYLIVPLFALANAGIAINGSFLARAFTSPVTLGILLATCSASRSGRSARRGCSAGSAGGQSGRPSAGRPWPAPAPSPESASSCRC